MKDNLKFYLYEIKDSWVFIDELKDKYNISYVHQLESNCIVITKNDKKSKKKSEMMLEAEKLENVKFWTKKELHKFIQMEAKRTLEM